VRAAVATIACWLGLWWLWQLLVGEWNASEWIAGAGAATVATAVGAAAWKLGGRRVSLRSEWVWRSWSVLPMVLVDFGILVYALVRSLARRRPVTGVFVAKTVDELRGRGDRAAGARVFAVLASMYSPNAYVVDADADDGTVLLHDLVRNPPSESPL
jgi:hypothetical protein